MPEPKVKMSASDLDYFSDSSEQNVEVSSALPQSNNCFGLFAKDE